MVRTIIISMMCSLVLFGCSCREDTTIKCEVQEVYKEVLYCPAPPHIARPDLPIKNMTPAQEANDGEFAKHTKATIWVLIGYIEELESIVNNQKEINKAYEAKKKELEKGTPPTE